jgi:2-amino-4-hydroxy-6-hydroxymethyldihydropteridine diphosphokinase
MCSASSKAPVLAYVALGSNLGDAVAIVLEAFGRLERLSRTPMRRSSLWQTTPVDCPPGSGLYVNAVAGLAPLDGEAPETLLEKLQALEREFGRRPKKIMNEPRPLDLDLISFGNEHLQTERLTLPHPRAHLRQFVLRPLSEIAGDLILPGQARTIAELLSELSSDERVQRLEQR